MLDVTCPACACTHVPLDVIAESQRLLDELGPCVGLASFECPVLYFAGLASPEMLAELRAANELANAAAAATRSSRVDEL